jgi:hypothetical protein
MYVAPRPDVTDDPLFAVRLASAAVLGFVVGIALQSPMPMMYPALFVGLMAGMRKAFDLRKALGGPISFIAILWLAGLLVSATANTPLLLVSVAGLVYFLAYYIIQRTGNPIGMLISIAMVLMSVMGMGSMAAMDLLQDSMFKAAFCSAFVFPLLYAMFPPRAKEHLVENYKPGHESGHAQRAAIRAFVLMLLSCWLYTVLDSSNMMMAVAAVFVLSFPTHETLFAEARERSYATVIGSAAALLILAGITYVGHLFMLLGLTFLIALLFASKMMNGRHPPMVYQFALSAAISVAGGALTSQEPMYATITRIALTMGGAVAAALLTSLLEALTIPPRQKAIQSSGSS